MEYKAFNETLLNKIGGKENISGLTHCMTRMRFKLKDESKAKTDEIKQMAGVVTVVQSGGQYQVVVGNHVADVYKEFVQVAGIQTDDSSEMEEDKPKGVLNNFIDIVSSIFTPIISVLMASGMIKGLLALLTAFSLLDKTSGIYLILNATGDGLFYFFPIFLGYTAAKKFGGKPFLGMAIGAALVYPTIVTANSGAGESLLTLFQGTAIESPIYVTFFGIPVILMSYTSSVIPIIAATYMASKVEGFFERIIPRAIRSFFVAFLTLLVTVPLTFLVIGPLTTWVGLIIGQGLSTAYEFSPIIAGTLIGGFWQIFIMFGLHWGFIPIALNNYATLGFDVVVMAGLATPLAMAGVTLAIFFKTKDRKLKEISLPAFLSAVFGITEPALYGVTLPRKKAFYATSVATAIAGGIMGIFKTRVYINGGTGIFAIPRFINPETGIDNSVIGFVVAIASAFVLGFVFTYFYAYSTKDDQSNVNEKLDEQLEEEEQVNGELGQNVMYNLATPISGDIVPLSEVEDNAFSIGLLGKGIAIMPSEGKVFAPADGSVTTLFPTHHAIGITTTDGIEVLIHVGMDTVNLDGRHFSPKVKQGDIVKKGQLLLEFDKEGIQKEGYSVITPVIISNTNQYLDILETSNKEMTQVGDEDFITVIA
ncbi:beta-glucoside-specific PTS transporter subunit IIABC [Marinilactibacillus kalidii]|uniref:beta-glucoside-specific PTS transporter subunit IIABC n=1 Tax=Marinilactibacillus kalidii TaxID=2820274 RepID=UPI001ABE36A9|nr:beta-glucoside-specific PTS transporter subunit IIABC [Marinilactibacillus kalidii]